MIKFSNSKQALLSAVTTVYAVISDVTNTTSIIKQSELSCNGERRINLSNEIRVLISFTKS